MQTMAEFINNSGSVAEAARQLGINRQTIDRWQNGSSKPSPAMLELARIKGVDLASQLVVPD